jgi:hypothetical protein
MNTHRDEAYKLRIQGFSYSEINSTLGVSKSTLSSWFKDLVLSDAALKRLQARVTMGVENGLLRHNKLQTVKAVKRASLHREAGAREITELTEKELILVGTALYWAEGFKRLKTRDGKERTAHPIRLVNADPDMIKLFIRFLQKSLGVESSEIFLTMRLYDHINKERAFKYWMDVTGLPGDNFRKVTWAVSGASKGIRPFNRLPWGTLEIEVCRTEKFHHLMGWIDGMKKGL